MIDRHFRGLAIGADEVGRGCLAGSIWSCSYVFLDVLQKVPDGILVRDSKKMSSRQRELAYDWLLSIPHIKSVVSTSVKNIDTIGIQKANAFVLAESLRQLSDMLSERQRQSAIAVIDGRIKVLGCAVETISRVQADNDFLCVSAASIIAKVERDRYMDALALRHPQYGWEVNKGYGTATHREAIMKHGVTKHHRKTFLSRIKFPARAT